MYYSPTIFIKYDDDNNTLIPGITNCSFGVQWIWKSLDTCVFDVRGYFAIIFGLISVFAWIIYAIPQIYENYKRGIPDEALSPLLLLFWTLGDIFNLVGGILTDQLALQLIVAGVSIAVDIIMSSQFFYYGYKHRQMVKAFQEQGPIEVEPIDGDSSINRSTASLAMFGSGLIFLSYYFQNVDKPDFHEYTMVINKRKLLSINMYRDDINSGSPLFPDYKSYCGYVLGWVSAVMYLASRFPQLYRNWRRKCTDGLSIGLFVLTVTGNTAYGLQIILTSTYSLFLLRALPWILGSLGVLFLDWMMFFQFYIYRKASIVYKVFEDETGEIQARPLFGTQMDTEAQIAPLV